MKNRKAYLILITGLVLGLLASSCQREDYGLENKNIQFRIETAPATRGFVNSSTINSDGTVVRVYDYLTGFSGKFDNQTGDLMYIDGKDLVYDGTGATWDFESGQLWQWTRTGTHNFFGILTEDHSVNPALTSADLWDDSSTDVAFNSSTRSFSIPTITFDTSTAQFDLCYSSWVNVESASRAGNHVVLPLKHAFMALAINIYNTSEDHINLESVELTGFKNRKSASFAYGASSLAYDNVGETPFLATWAGTKDLNKDKRYDLLTGNDISGTPAPAPNYILMWPQTAQEVEGANIVVRYTIENVWDPDNPSQLLEYEKVLPLKNSGLSNDLGEAVAMNAGTRYNLGIQFKGKGVELTIIPMEWEMQYSTIDYSTNSIIANSNKANDGVLWLYNWVWDDNNDRWIWVAGNRNREITMINGKVQGRFFILSPTSGQWRITTYPADAAQYFKIEPSEGLIDDLYSQQGDFLGEVVFEVTPVGVVTVTTTLHFNIDIRINGMWRNGNTEFNRKDWKLTREP